MRKSIDWRAPRAAHARAPVLVKVEAIHLDLRRDAARQRVKGSMEAQQRRDEIDERRFI